MKVSTKLRQPQSRDRRVALSRSLTVLECDLIREPRLADTVVTIPCYNEAARLDGGPITDFVDRHPNVRLVFVDDGSRDDTLAVLRALADSRAGRMDVVEQHPNGGKAQAVRRGVQHALSLRPAYFGYWDADLATPLEMIPRFVDLLEARPEIDVVMGARVALLGRAIERHPVRHYIGRVAASAISAALGLPVYDTQCGAKLFRASGDVPALFTEPFVTNWAFDVEILARLIRSRAGSGPVAASKAIYEYPLPEWRDVPGSKVNGADYLGAIADLWRIHRNYLRGLPRGAAYLCGSIAPTIAPARAPAGVE